MVALVAAMAASEGGKTPEGEALKGIPVIDGTFTVRSAPGMRILANNTDEGPVASTTGEALVWKISPRTAQAPTALLAATR